MYLKSISLRGFKSFAERTNLDFESGISVIVGPNGSGKSNITDAALWVLGEQSPLSLRGSAMEDVIFTGSKERPPLGVSEVTICLDNSSGFLPIEYTDVTIKRRLSRSGESSYFINNNPCRLLDVLELISDTGLGRDTYCIISQGRLEETLNSRPEEKRVLIEEAAGVLKHKKRKERAERKLVSMEQKLFRVRDVKREVNRQIRPIERQTTNAEKYLKIQKELREFMIREAILSLKELQSKWDEISSSEENLSEKVKLLEKDMVDLEAKAESAQNVLEEKGSEVAEISRKNFKLLGLKDRLASGAILLEEKGKNLVEKLSDSRQKIYSLDSARKTLQDESEKLEAEKENADFELTEKYNLLADLRKKSEQARKERVSVEKEIGIVEKALLGHISKVDNLEKSMEALNFNIRNHQQNIETISKSINKLKKEEATTKKIITESTQKKDQIQSELDEKKRLLEETKERISDNQNRLSDHSHNAENLKLEISEKKARVKALEEIGKSHHGVPSGTSYLLELEISGIIGSLDQLVEVKSGYERAIEAILGIDLYCLVAETRKDIISALHTLDREEKGGATFIALDELELKAMPENLPSEAIWAPEVISCLERIQPVVNHFLGGAVIIDSLVLLEGKWSLGELLTVDRKGALVHPGGKITYGLFGKGETSTLEQKKEIDDLKDLLEDLEEKYNQIDNELAEYITLNNRLQTDKSNFNEEIHRLETQEQGLEIRREQAKLRLTEVTEEINNLTNQCEQHQFTMQREQSQLEQTKSEITEFRREISEIDLNVEDMKKNAVVYFQNEKDKSEKLSKCQLDIASISQKNVYLKRQVLNLKQELKEKTQALEVTEQAVSAYDQLHLRIDPLYQLCTILLEKLEGFVQDLIEKTELEDKQTDNLRESLRQIQQEIKEKSATIATTKEKKHRFDVDLATLEVQVNEAVQKIVDEYDLPLEKALQEYGDEYTAEVIKDKIVNLQEKVERIGPVNPIAAEEYERLIERKHLLEEQIKDIEDSRKALKKIIEVIDKKIRERFQESFEIVNQNFQMVFNKLFPGGTAELYLTDQDNLEETGVEIYAQPEGKKLKKLTLLSGGEKALVAIALLFAVFYSRPSPFYILDEVEPALDDINLNRFIGLLEHLKKRTQFLIISHQRRTMEIADSLYGVSMQADGVSRVISQKLSDMVEAG